MLDSSGKKNKTVIYPFKPVNMTAQPVKKKSVLKPNLFQQKEILKIKTISDTLAKRL